MDVHVQRLRRGLAAELAGHRLAQHDVLIRKHRIAHHREALAGIEISRNDLDLHGSQASPQVDEVHLIFPLLAEHHALHAHAVVGIVKAGAPELGKAAGRAVEWIGMGRADDFKICGFAHEEEFPDSLAAVVVDGLANTGAADPRMEKLQRWRTVRLPWYQPSEMPGWGGDIAAEPRPSAPFGGDFDPKNGGFHGDAPAVEFAGADLLSPEWQAGRDGFIS